MNTCNYIVWDLETTGVNPKTAQIVQIGAVCVDPRKLEIVEGSEFDCLCKPLYGEECAKAGLEELSDGAIRVHGKTHEILSTAQSVDSAIANFREYVKAYNYKKTIWQSPIPVGYNTVGYDHPILDRELSRLSTPNFFHPLQKVDLIHWMFAFFENDKDVNSLSADNLIRGKMGYSKGRAHDALSDVIMTAELFCKTMRLLRKTAAGTKFDGCFA